MVIFRCGPIRCAVDRATVAQILPLPALSRPPTAPSLIAGFANVGGEAVPVIDAGALFATAPDPDVDPIYRHVLVLQLRAGRAGLLVDRVEDVRAAPPEADSAIAPEETLNGCVTGMVSFGDGAVHMLDASRLLLKAEQALLDELRKEEQRRLDAWAAP